MRYAEAITEQIEALRRDAQDCKILAAACGSATLVATGVIIAAVTGGEIDSGSYLPLSLFGGLAAGTVSLGIEESLSAVQKGQEVAALSGALAQHELQASVLFDQDA